MRHYIATPSGESLAMETGVDALAARLHDQDYDKPLEIIASLTEDRSFSMRNLTEDIREARSLLKTPTELAHFDRAMALDTETSSWRHEDGEAEGTLFPTPAIKTYTQAEEEDRLILSGAAGLSLANFRGQCPLLARNRYPEYGFKSFNESCAFVGAYVVNKLIQLSASRFKEPEPSFQYLANNMQHTVMVGGTIHGDFRMAEVKVPQADIISPLNTKTEFSPEAVTAVAGYHSIEPDIVATLIEAEFLRGGKAAALALVDELVLVLKYTAKTDPRDTNESPFTFPAFADYGDRDVRYSLTTLRLLISKEGFNPLRLNKALHSTAYLPQSSTKFDIVPTDKGVLFRNSNEQQSYEGPGVEIGREQYPLLFKTLVGQTSEGLGRTAPNQLVELVYRAKRLLVNGPSDDDY